MSSRCLESYKEYEFSGNISQECISFGDIDHDGYNELVIGTIEGQLVAYRAAETKPFLTLSDLGVITVTLIGDFLHAHVNSILCITHVGKVYVWALRSAYTKPVTDDKSENTTKSIQPIDDNTSPTGTNLISTLDAEVKNTELVVLLHSQRMPPNTKYVVAHDFDADGYPEILLGMTDRTVRLYKWKEDEQQQQQQLLSPTAKSHNNGQIAGSFIGIYKWEFASQIGSISLLDLPVNQQQQQLASVNNISTVRVLVSQAGGRYSHIDCSVRVDDDGVSRIRFSDPVQHELASVRMRNSNEYTWIVGNVRSYAKKTTTAKVLEKNLCALCTSHGNIMVVDGNNILLDFQVERKLHFIQKFDITGDGDDEIIVFADRTDVLLGGLAYIIDSQFRVAKFWLPETPKVIYAGYIGIPTTTTTTGSNQQQQHAALQSKKVTKNSFCFACFTINNRLLVFYDIPRPNFAPHSMLARFKEIFVADDKKIGGDDDVDNEGTITHEQYLQLSNADKRRMLRELVETKGRRVFNDVW